MSFSAQMEHIFSKLPANHRLHLDNYTIRWWYCSKKSRIVVNTLRTTSWTMITLF